MRKKTFWPYDMFFNNCFLDRQLLAEKKNDALMGLMIGIDSAAVYTGDAAGDVILCGVVPMSVTDFNFEGGVATLKKPTKSFRSDASGTADYLTLNEGDEAKICLKIYLPSYYEDGCVCISTEELKEGKMANIKEIEVEFDNLY